MAERVDTVVIGGGQAGLAMSAVLRGRGREHVVLERYRVGERWRTERWDSLRFQFPNWSLLLPGYSYMGDDPDGFAHHAEILALIEEYAASIEVPVREHTEVTALRRADDGFSLKTTDVALWARNVVIATGPFQRPHTPAFADAVPSSILQLDPTSYRNPSQLPDGGVLVVGSGASGTQIGDELLRSGRRVFLSVSRHRRAPRRYRGKDVYWWLEAMGRFNQTIDSLPGREWPPSVVVTGVQGGYDVDVRQLARDGATVLGSVLGVDDSTLGIDTNANRVLDDADAAYAGFLSVADEWAAANPQVPLGSDDRPPGEGLPWAVPATTTSLDLHREEITTVIWATGYRYDYPWLGLPVFDQRGRPAQERGVTSVPGLYFLGLHWMHTFRSGLLSGVGFDAEYLAEHIDRVRI